MKKSFPLFLLAASVATLPLVPEAIASSIQQTSLKDQVAQAIAICRGTVVQLNSFRDPLTGAIRTAALIKVDEALKGVFPNVVRLVHEGGVVDQEGQQDGFSPRFRIGERRLFLLSRRTDGGLAAANGFASTPLLQESTAANDPQVAAIRSLIAKASIGDDVRDQAANWSGIVPGEPVAKLDAVGLMTDLTYGVPSRYLQPDRGEAIEYLVDAQTLPAGLTLAQCLDATTNAFAAWSAATGIQFQFAGLENFGMAAPNVSASDGRIRVQLHDSFSYIGSSTTLGRGGRGYTIANGFQNGGMGGKVADQEFFPTTRGYVVLNHTSASMQTLATFEEVLAHEIGHSLGMAHSSEDQFEPAGDRREALMFYLAHRDGRGATLGNYDPPIVRKAHPLLNTPPYGYARVMDIVTASTPPNVAGINSVQIAGYDLQGDTLTVALSNPSQLNGSFSLQGNLLRYTANGAFSDTARFDPAGTSYRDAVYVRYSDGVNGSPYIRVRVLSYNFDSSPSDGIPNSWAQQYFGSATPSAANLTRAQDDKDGDGLTNLEEWLAGTSPIDAGSNLAITSFDGSTIAFAARPYELYEVVGTSDFTTWTPAANPILPTGAAGTVNPLSGVSGVQFFQIRRVP